MMRCACHFQNSTGLTDKGGGASAPAWAAFSSATRDVTPSNERILYLSREKRSSICSGQTTNTR